MAALEPTPEQLDAALALLHSHQLLLDVAHPAQATPAQLGVVRMHARLQARGIASLSAMHQRPVVVPPEPPHPVGAVRRFVKAPAPAARTHKRPPHDLFDPKAAAAGESVRHDD